ncbi:MAG: hypothetical protein M3256_15285 [Actinomycetota bacterium]|nr:hypothetical protein [Actinomycetota bacterium]
MPRLKNAGWDDDQITSHANYRERVVGSRQRRIGPTTTAPSPRPKKQARKAQVLGVGGDARNQFTVGPDARAGHRSATNSRPAGPFVGGILSFRCPRRPPEAHPGMTKPPLPGTDALVSGVSRSLGMFWREHPVVWCGCGGMITRWRELLERQFMNKAPQVQSTGLHSHHDLLI